MKLSSFLGFICTRRFSYFDVASILWIIWLDNETNTETWLLLVISFGLVFLSLVLESFTKALTYSDDKYNENN